MGILCLGFDNLTGFFDVIVYSYLTFSKQHKIAQEFRSILFIENFEKNENNSSSLLFE